MRKQSSAAPRRARAPQVQSEPKLPFSRQHQKQPGNEAKRDPPPRWQATRYRAAGKLGKAGSAFTGILPHCYTFP